MAKRIIFCSDGTWDAKFALDTKHESWNVAWLLPRRRSIAANAGLGDSVTFRCQNDSCYRPANLTLTGGLPVAGYGKTFVISQAAQAAG
jgi:hypothetical protein